MKRLYLLLPLMVLLAITSFGQSYEGTVEFDKKKQQAFVIDYSYSPEAVENAIVQKIEKMGYTSKTEKGLFNKNKGFIVFKNAVISDIDPVQHDYMLKIEKKSRKSDDETTLYLLIMSDDQNQLPAMKTDEVARAKYFLNNLLPEIEEAKLELEIKGNEESIVKSEKKYKDLQDEKADLEKKLKKNAEDIDKQAKQIEVQRGSLDALKGKRKSSVVPASTPSSSN
ncbi:MAG: hypothetical protein EOO05_09170 [Chitinophagaceae bacterium]|nr:MAG: hypothetical protein EOO05_09170 [Chitinophagaceae bacterium]